MSAMNHSYTLLTKLEDRIQAYHDDLNDCFLSYKFSNVWEELVTSHKSIVHHSADGNIPSQIVS